MDSNKEALLVDVETGDMMFRINGRNMTVLAVNYEYGNEDSIGEVGTVFLNGSELIVEYIDPDDKDSNRMAKKTGFIKYMPNSIGGDSIG